MIMIDMLASLDLLQSIGFLPKYVYIERENFFFFFCINNCDR